MFTSCGERIPKNPIVSISSTQNHDTFQPYVTESAKTWKEKYLSVIIDLWESDLNGFGFDVALYDLNNDGIPELFYIFKGETEGFDSIDMYYLKDGKVEKKTFPGGGVLKNNKTGESAFYRYQYGSIRYFGILPCVYRLTLDKNGVIYDPIYTYEFKPDYEYLLQDNFLEFNISNINNARSGYINLDIFQNDKKINGLSDIAWNDAMYPELLKLVDGKMNFYFNNEKTNLSAKQYNDEATAFLNSFTKVDLNRLNCVNNTKNNPAETKDEFRTYVLAFLNEFK